jgi:hypothetical protein
MSTLFDDTGLAAALWIVIKASALLGVAALAQWRSTGERPPRRVISCGLLRC